MIRAMFRRWSSHTERLNPTGEGPALDWRTWLQTAALFAGLALVFALAALIGGPS